jgi:hypothetical protein
LAATPEGFIHQAGCENGLAIESVQPGTIVVVRTKHSRYRFLILSVAQRTIRVLDGSPLPEGTPAVLQGSTAGGSFVKAGWIGIGLRMELCVGRQRIVTSPVGSITVQS